MPADAISGHDAGGVAMSDLAVKTHGGNLPPLRSEATPTTTWRLSKRSVRNGAISAAAMALFYVVVRGASGSWEHLADQARATGTTSSPSSWVSPRRSRSSPSFDAVTGSALP